MNNNTKKSPVSYAKTKNLCIAYDTFGNHCDPPLILIMGLSFQMIMWEDDFCSAIADRGFLVIRFDNRDVGLSTKFDKLGVPNISKLNKEKSTNRNIDVPYTLCDMANDAIALLDFLSIKSAHVAGMSMGGLIGQLIAIHQPNCIRTLTTIMSTTNDPSLPYPKLLGSSILFTPLPTNRTSYIKRFSEILKILSGPHFPIEKLHAQKIAEKCYERGLNPEGVARQFAAAITTRSTKDKLKLVRIPTLVIHGSKDILVPVECGVDIANSVHMAELLIIEGMGHTLPRVLWPKIISAMECHMKSYERVLRD